MRFYTKEWYTLMDSFGNVDMFEPVLDKEYTDAEIEALYQDMEDKYVQEERDAYDEPPYIPVDDDELADPDDFDPEDYLIGIIDEEGEEVDLHHPESYEELLEYLKQETERELREYENRLPFDEEEARSEFRENYKDYLEEPDEDIPEWVRKEVDVRLLAMGALPEGVYKRLKAEEEKNEAAFDVLDAAADEAFGKMYADIPDEYTDMLDDFENVDGEYVIEINEEGGDVTVVLSGWDEDGDEERHSIIFEQAEVTEDEGLSINVEVDEDGDTVSDCDLLFHEVYYDNGRFEVHMMFENNGLKYLTLNCSDITFECTSVE